MTLLLSACRMPNKPGYHSRGSYWFLVILTSYRKISQSLESVRLGVTTLISLWQAVQKPCCRDVCESSGILEKLNHSNRPRIFETSQNLTLNDTSCDIEMIPLAVVVPWWRNQMETFSALLVLCVGNSPVTGEFPRKGQWRKALMFSLICALTKRLSKQYLMRLVIWDAIALIMTSL